MKVGFNLLLWATHVTDEHFHMFDALKAAGYDGVEIPLFEGDPEHFAAVRRRTEDAGLDTTTVMIMPGNGRSAVSAKDADRDGALQHLKWAIDCSTALGSEVLCGPFHQPLGEFTGRGPTEEEKVRCAEVHKQAAQYAARSNLALSVEPLNRFECYFMNTAASGLDMFERVGEPNYGYLYDTFHFNIEEKSQPDAIRATAQAINHVHISNNDRGTPGTGPIDFAAVFQALRAVGYDRWLTVEAFGQALPDLAAATRVWRPLFRAPEEVYLGAVRLIRDGWEAARA